MPSPINDGKWKFADIEVITTPSTIEKCSGEKSIKLPAIFLRLSAYDDG